MEPRFRNKGQPFDRIVYTEYGLKTTVQIQLHRKVLPIGSEYACFNTMCTCGTHATATVGLYVSVASCSVASFRTFGGNVYLPVVAAVLCEA